MLIFFFFFFFLRCARGSRLIIWGLAPGMVFKLYTSVEKGLKKYMKNFWGIIPTFVEVTGKNGVERSVFTPHPEWLLTFL